MPCQQTLGAGYKIRLVKRRGEYIVSSPRRQQTARAINFADAAWRKSLSSLSRASIENRRAKGESKRERERESIGHIHRDIGDASRPRVKSPR